MNKILHINLGGAPFSIDEDAYEQLKIYLESIHQYFNKSQGYEEITTDIEARLAELLKEQLGPRSIASRPDIEVVSSIMGLPEDFAAEAEELELGAEKQESGSDKKKEKWFNTGKRLFLNPDEMVVGGVCSGIAAFLGISDPIWVRVFFGLLVIAGFGSGILIYLLLWAVLPKAETASDRLAMRGDPINVANIGKLIEQELQKLSAAVSEMGDAQGKKKRYDFNTEFHKTFEEGVSFLRKLSGGLVTAMGNFLKPLAVFFGIALILGLILVFLGCIGTVLYHLPMVSSLFDKGSSLPLIGLISLCLFLGIPVISVVLLVSRVAYHRRSNIWIRSLIPVCWVLSIVGLMQVGMTVLRQFGAGTEQSKDLPIPFEKTDTLKIKFAKGRFYEAMPAFFDEIAMAGNQLIIGHLPVELAIGDTPNFRLEQITYSRGPDIPSAEKFAAEIQLDINYKDQNILLPMDFLLQSGQAWRFQQVKLILYVPEGKSIKIGWHDYGRLSSVPPLLGEKKVFIDDMKDQGKTFILKMNKKGMICENCPEEKKNNEESKDGITPPND